MIFARLMLKKNPFGHYLILKKWLIRYMGFMTHRRYRGFNELKIEGSDIIKNLPDKNVLFISNHQTYFADVVAMLHVLTRFCKILQMLPSCSRFQQNVSPVFTQPNTIFCKIQKRRFSQFWCMDNVPRWKYLRVRLVTP